MANASPVTKYTAPAFNVQMPRLAPSVKRDIKALIAIAAKLDIMWLRSSLSSPVNYALLL